MNKFLERPEEWTEMGKVGISRAQSHSLNNTVHAYEEYYEMVIEKQVGVEKPVVHKGWKISDVYRPKKVVKQ
jgi:hypothetical protein